MAAHTLAAVAGATASELLMVRDTVAVETLALAATLRMSIGKKHITFRGMETRKSAGLVETTWAR